MEPLTNCRVCAGTDLTSLFSLGEQYVSDFLAGGAVGGVKCPIELVLCGGCGLVQQRYTAPQDFLYSRHYWYRSNQTRTMINALREITAAVESRLDLKRGDVVLDIGSNTGDLLRSYAVDGLVRVGVEPATNLAAEGAKGLDVFINDFWSAASYYDHLNLSHPDIEHGKSGIKSRQARCVTAIGMFYDLDDPNTFIADIAKVLRPDGMFVAQLMCLRQTLELGDVGNLCHEHLSLFPLKTLQHLYEQHGLEIFDVEENNVNGGSYRVWARLKENTLPPKPAGCKQRLEGALRWESGYDDLRTYAQFWKVACANREQCVEFLRSEAAKGKRTWWYGASTKSNVLLQWYDVAKYIEAATDKDERKHGLYTVGSGLHIASLEEFRRAKPNYAVIGPYAFAKEIMETEREWMRNGGKFLVSLPSFKVVSL